MYTDTYLPDSQNPKVTKDAHIPCPRCNQLINAHAHYCEFCGVDLAIAAAVAERDLLPVSEELLNTPMSPEILVPRLGDYLRERGVLDENDLQRALKYQADLASEGQTCLVGEALVRLGIIDRETLDGVVTEQILQLQSALQDANRTLERRVQERTAELQQALRRLAELNQLKSNFISNISHELRTPLTHIKGYLELLSDGELGELQDSQLHAIQVALRSSSRLEKLIEDLLQFSLAVRGELSLKLDEIDFCVLLQKYMDLYRPKAVAKNIHFEFHLPECPMYVNIDVEKMEWVLDQLLDNAIKFTPSDGFVWVAAEISEGLVTISINDSGIGIPDEKIGEIFQLFHQLDGSNTRRFQGTGLGLAFVHRILDAHGSQITVQSEVGKGSRFQFSFPLIHSEDVVRS
jgi:signal transduction histidine kinase